MGRELFVGLDLGEIGGRDAQLAGELDLRVAALAPQAAQALDAPSAGAGAFTKEHAAYLPADDWRSRSPDFTSDNLRRNLALVEAFRSIAERRGTTVAAVAVAWTLAWPGVTGAIVGARRPAQVDGWIGAAALELTDAALDEIAVAIRRTGAGSNPERPRATAPVAILYGLWVQWGFSP